MSIGHTLDSQMRTLIGEGEVCRDFCVCCVSYMCLSLLFAQDIYAPHLSHTRKTAENNGFSIHLAPSQVDVQCWTGGGRRGQVD